MRTKYLANAAFILGLALMISGAVSCRLYQPKWTPPPGGGNEYFDGTGLERFILFAAPGAALFFLGLYLRDPVQTIPTAGGNMRQWGFRLVLLSFFVRFLPLFGLGTACFGGGIALIVWGTLSDRKERREKAASK